MKRIIKAVFFDLDGSTLGSDLLFPGSFLSVVNRYHDRKWIITTGRGVWSVSDLKLHTEFDPDTPHIFDNGGLICRMNGESLLKNILSNQEKKEVLSFLPTLNCVDSVYVSVFPSTGFCWSTGKLSVLGYKSLISFNDYETFANAIMNSVITKFSIKSETAITFPGELTVVRNQNSYDILNILSKKGNAINIVREHFSLQAKEIAFIWDDHNDLSAVKDPTLSNMYLIKVGSNLPDVKSDIHVLKIQDVGYHLESILAK
jgi:hydroxymethylpyrimidine pyrophosphatase-like HAD family hydrolase